MQGVKQKSVISIKIDEEMKDRLDLYASQKGISRNALIRDFLSKGLEISSYKNDIDFITNIIKESIFEILTPKMERMIALQSKTCIASASGYFLLGDVMQRFIPYDQRIGAKEAIETAKKEGVKYTKLKSDIGEE